METLSRLNTIFGEQLRNARKTAHLTQEELAFRADLDRTYISLLERGLKSPTLTTFSNSAVSLINNRISLSLRSMHN